MPEGLRRDDLWIFDLRRADFSYGIPSQHASIAGASWKEVRCAQTPKARDASPFCVLGSQACFLYGGRTGFDGVDAQVLDDLWCFTGTWQPVKYKGTTPGPRDRPRRWMRARMAPSIKSIFSSSRLSTGSGPS